MQSPEKMENPASERSERQGFLVKPLHHGSPEVILPPLLPKILIILMGIFLFTLSKGLSTLHFLH
jgi:hypothetical protein